mgnify:CR=1 FL=1
MLFFSDDLVKKYISGDDLPINIEQLENNYDFMVKVINTTNDKRMVKCCSESLMNNYDFIKYLIDKFKHDTKFIEKVALEYLRKTKDDDIIFELSIIISKYSNDEYLKTECALRARSRYNALVMILESEKSLGNLDNKNYGLGYFYMNALYNYSDEIKEYCAKILLDNIFFNKEKLPLEKTIHKVYKTPDTILKQGKNNYLLNVIKVKDISLYEYVSVHLDLLNKEKEELDRILKNWDSYVRSLNDDRFRKLYDEIYDYNSNSLTTSSSKDIFEYVIEESNFFDLYKTTDFYKELSESSEELDDIIANMSDEDYTSYLESKNYDMPDISIDYPKITKDDLKVVNYGRIVLKQLFKEDYIDDSNNEKYIDYDKKLVIIK